MAWGCSTAVQDEKYRSDKRWNKGRLRNQTYHRDICWNRASHYTCRTWFPIRRRAGLGPASVVRRLPNQRPLFDTTSRKPNPGSFAKTMRHFISVYSMRWQSEVYSSKIWQCNKFWPENQRDPTNQGIKVEIQISLFNLCFFYFQFPKKWMYCECTV